MLYATTATTHVGNIRRNLERIRERVTADRPDRLVLAAVKADAYGHGAIKVARMMERTGLADWLGVATVPEAMELREAGVTLPILKLSHCLDAAEVAVAIAADVTLSVVDAASVDAAEQAAAAAGRTIGVHLKVDTGMRRIGCEPADAPGLAQRIDAAPHLDLGGIFSHLPISDVPAGDDFTRAQIALFASTVAAVEEARGPVPLKHLANSGAVLAHPDAWFDMVRPGIMIYGSLPDPACPATVELEPGLSWKTVVSFVKPVASGETVGYGRTWTAASDTTIATVPIGYADGFTRANSASGTVLIRGREFPLAGRVCMDQVMVDVGPENEAGVRPGDEVVLIGRSFDRVITCAEVAERTGTIPYEVTCLIAGRVTRGYDFA